MWLLAERIRIAWCTDYTAAAPLLPPHLQSIAKALTRMLAWHGTQFVQPNPHGSIRSPPPTPLVGSTTQFFTSWLAWSAPDRSDRKQEAAAELSRWDAVSDRSARHGRSSTTVSALHAKSCRSHLHCPRLGAMTTNTATVTLPRVRARLPEATIAVTRAATASVAATSLNYPHIRHCLRATTRVGTGKPVFSATAIVGRAYFEIKPRNW